MKHILMPMANSSRRNTISQPLTDEFAERPTPQVAQSFTAGVGDHQCDPEVDRHSSREFDYCNTIPIGNLKANSAWSMNCVPVTGLDSVLNQSPSHHNHYSPAGNQNIPTVLQPMWPPCLGPTATHNPGPYGPYWPNGAFVPYRPAPFRDPKFHSAEVHNHTEMASHLQPDFTEYQEWTRARSNSQPSCSGDRPTTYNAHLKNESPNTSTRFLYASPTQHSETSSSQASQSQYNLAYREKPWYRNSGSTVAFNKAVNSNFDSSVSGLTLEDGSVGLSGNAQFKEKILSWAHRIYGNLLASIEQARRSHSSEYSSTCGQSQSSFYPNPPRRPYPSWSTKNNRDNRPHTTSRSAIGIARGEDGSQDEYVKMSQAPSSGNRGSSNDQFALSNPMSTIPISATSSQHRPQMRLRDRTFRPHVFTAQPSHVPPQVIEGPAVSVPTVAAVYAMEMLGRLCQESEWEWTDGMLLNGCLAYGLGDYHKAMKWYHKVLQCDPHNVEAMSNLAATLFSLDRRQDAESYWLQSVKLRPSYFEAVEHLIGLLYEDHRGREAVRVIDYVEHALRRGFGADPKDEKFEASISARTSSSARPSETSLSSASQGFSPSGYTIPACDNGRLLALIHGKGNALYQIGDNPGAAKAFEDAILIGAGRRQFGIRGLIKKILDVFSSKIGLGVPADHEMDGADEPILLPPEMALETSHLVFPSRGHLPGLEEVSHGMSQKAAVSIVSNSLLSLAKIYQDGMSSSGAAATAPRATSGVQEILALYYLSLSLQPSPSTANNVGILLAGVQQSANSNSILRSKSFPPCTVPGVVPGSGVALALAYYDYGLKLDARHAHLYTNLGSLFKDIGQLTPAIKMYERAVDCDGRFDIALANLANAVKDKGEIGDAIKYYKRAVTANPNFAEAVCGLANALNSVCSWSGRGGVRFLGGKRDRWHVDERGLLYDSKISCNTSSGWIERVVAIVEKQLQDGQSWGKGVIHSVGIERMLYLLGQLPSLCGEGKSSRTAYPKMALDAWAERPWEGAKVVRLIERTTKILGWQIYRNKFIHRISVQASNITRPQLPAALTIPSAPTVLPFHTFTCPLSAKQIRKISQRNGLRVSCSTLRAPWLPIQLYEPPSPPDPHLNVGYVSSDFNNHPLAHLMQSVFGFHDPNRVNAICYATTASDGSTHRQQIEREAPKFYDASSWSIERLVNQVVADGVHILVNLNGYTRGARNEVFAARPAPIQMSFMGFAGTLGAEWCDYLLADKIAVPAQTLRPWRGNASLMDQIQDGNNDDDQDDWVYGENIIFARDTFFCCDHRQSAPDSQDAQLSWQEEQRRRWKMRKELFPDISDETIILGNFNQLYKVVRSFFTHQMPTQLISMSPDRADYVSHVVTHIVTRSQSCSLAPPIP